MRKEFEPIEVIRRIKDRRALVRYFKETHYVIPNTFEGLFISQQGTLSYITGDMTEEEARRYVQRLVRYYIERFTVEPQIFELTHHNGKRNREQVEQLIEFCDQRQWYQLRVIVRFIRRNCEASA